MRRIHPTPVVGVGTLRQIRWKKVEEPCIQTGLFIFSGSLDRQICYNNKKYNKSGSFMKIDENKEGGVVGIVDPQGKPKILYGFEYCPEKERIRIKFSKWGRQYFDAMGSVREGEVVSLPNFTDTSKAGVLLGLPVNQDAKFLKGLGIAGSVMNVISYAKQNSDPEQKFIVADSPSHFAGLCNRKIEIPGQNIFSDTNQDLDRVIQAVEAGAKELYFRERGGALKQVRVKVAEKGSNAGQALVMNHLALKTLKRNGIRAVESSLMVHGDKVLSFVDNPLRSEIPYSSGKKVIVRLKDVFAGSTYMSMNDIRFAFGGEFNKYTQFDAPQAINRMLDAGGIRSDIFKTVLLFNYVMGNSDFSGESFGFLVRAGEESLHSEFCPVFEVVSESTVNNSGMVGDFGGSSVSLSQVGKADLLDAHLPLRFIESSDPVGFDRSFGYALELRDAFMKEIERLPSGLKTEFSAVIKSYFNGPSEYKRKGLESIDLDMEETYEAS